MRVNEVKNKLYKLCGRWNPLHHKPAIRKATKVQMAARVQHTAIARWRIV